MEFRGQTLMNGTGPKAKPIPDRLYCDRCRRGNVECRPDRAECVALYQKHRADIAEAKARVLEGEH